MNVIVIHNLANGKHLRENKQVESGISDDSCVSYFWFTPYHIYQIHHKAIPFNGDSCL